MGIQYHPDVAEALWCNYDGIEPEMVKRRLVVVVSPKAAQRHRLVTVVPISATKPEVIKPWHFKLSRDPLPDGNKAEVWVKCDMINVVCFRNLPRSPDSAKVELSGMFRLGGSHEEVAVHRDADRLDSQTG
jgi:uncharacterized protein YifN (PemK superfamily)